MWSSAKIPRLPFFLSLFFFCTSTSPPQLSGKFPLNGNVPSTSPKIRNTPPKTRRVYRSFRFSANRQLPFCSWKTNISNRNKGTKRKKKNCLMVFFCAKTVHCFCREGFVVLITECLGLMGTFPFSSPSLPCNKMRHNYLFRIIQHSPLKTETCLELYFTLSIFVLTCAKKLLVYPPHSWGFMKRFRWGFMACTWLCAIVEPF